MGFIDPLRVVVHRLGAIGGIKEIVGEEAAINGAFAHHHVRTGEAKRDLRVRIGGSRVLGENSILDPVHSLSYGPCGPERDTNGEKDELEIEGDGEEIEEEELELKAELAMLVLEDGEDAGGENDEEEVESNMSSFEALLDQENAEHYEDCCPIQDEEEDDEISLFHHLFSSPESNEESLQQPPRLSCTLQPSVL